jgi:hypothetical protein
MGPALAHGVVLRRYRAGGMPLQCGRATLSGPRWRSHRNCAAYRSHRSPDRILRVQNCVGDDVVCALGMAGARGPDSTGAQRVDSSTNPGAASPKSYVRGRCAGLAAQNCAQAVQCLETHLDRSTRSGPDGCSAHPDGTGSVCRSGRRLECLRYGEAVRRKPQTNSRGDEAVDRHVAIRLSAYRSTAPCQGHVAEGTARGVGGGGLRFRRSSALYALVPARLRLHAWRSCARKCSGCCLTSVIDRTNSRLRLDAEIDRAFLQSFNLARGCGGDSS